MEPEVIADYACITGEGPLWHADEKRLYWLDIPQGRLFRYDPATNTHEIAYRGDVVGGFTIQADGALLFFGARGAVHLWRGGPLTTLIDEIPAEREGRFNDVIADPAGRVFCGSMPAERGLPSRLYRLDTDGTLALLLDDVGLSNGMGFTPGLTRMYHSDTRKFVINIYDHDQATGALTNGREFARVSDVDVEGRPDGLTVDAEGFVWSARYGGGCVVRYAPDGTEERRIAFPARNVTSLTFGGDDYSEMYVTTAGGDNRAENGPGAGALFRIRPGIRGVPEFRSAIRTG